MTPLLLVINSGSSSVKFQIFSYSSSLDLLAHGAVVDLGTQPSFQVKKESEHKKTIIELNATDNHEQAIELIVQWVSQQNKFWELQAVVHRVVHGADLFKHSILITQDIIQQLKKLSPLAPLHQPHNIAAIEIIKQIKPDIAQIACFDTAFHAQHQALFTTYALPKQWRELGIKRYGFHGLSYEWIAHTIKQDYPDLIEKRIVVAHLGNGASLCALHNGLSIDTTMGLTALDGLPMGTRCGSIDPGALIYMQRNLNLTADELEQILYNESGLLGLSELSNDVKELQASTSEQAQFALDYFCLKAAQFIGMMTISLGGIEALVFTGGIGENASLVRNKILNQLQCLQPFSELVLPANEEKMMAMHAVTLLNL